MSFADTRSPSDENIDMKPFELSPAPSMEISPPQEAKAKNIARRRFKKKNDEIQTNKRIRGRQLKQQESRESVVVQKRLQIANDFYRGKLTPESLKETFENDKNLERLEKFIATLGREQAVTFFGVTVSLLERCPKPLEGNLLRVAHIMTRAHHITKASLEMENTVIAPQEALKIAFFIEMKLTKVANKAQAILKQRETGLSRTLQIDTQNKTVHVLAKRKTSKLQAKGSFKKAVFAARLALDNVRQTPHIDVRVFSKSKAGGEPMHPDHLQSTIKEAELYQQLQGIPGIAKMHSFTVYDLQLKGQEKPIQRISMIFERCDGSLQKVYAQQTKLSEEQYLQLAQQFIDTIDAMHQRGIIHGDLKPDNLLYRIDPKTNNIEVKITDLGFCRKVHNQQPFTDKEAPGAYNQGFYGSLDYTSPELLAQNSFAGSHTQNEMYAVGVTLYQLYLKKSPYWAGTARNCYYNQNTQSTVTKAQESLTQAVKAEIDTRALPFYIGSSSPKLPFSQFFDRFYTGSSSQKKMEKLSFAEFFDRLIAHCMHSDPKVRFTAAQAKQAIDDYLAMNS